MAFDLRICHSASERSYNAMRGRSSIMAKSGVTYKSAIGLVQICRVMMATQDALQMRPPAAEDHAYFQLACCDSSL